MRLLLFLVFASTVHILSLTNSQAQDASEPPDRLEFEISNQSLTFTHRCSVGALNEPEEELFGSSQDVLVGSDGTLIIADRDAGDLRLFDQTCAFEAATGQRGQGPGEFQWISSMIRAEDDQLIVFDNNNVRLSRFEVNGGFEQVESLSLDLSPTAIYQLYSYPDERFAIVGNIPGKDELVHIYESDGTYSHSFASLLEINDEEYDNQVVRAQVNQGLLVQPNNSETIVVLRSPYRLAKYDTDYNVIWTAEEALWDAPWEGYISITQDSYQVGFYPQILFTSSRGDALFLVEHADFEAGERFLDFRSIETGALVDRTAIDFERELVAWSHDHAASGYAVFKSSVDYPKFFVYRWTLE